jgi:protein O-mannosyl-transferase
MAKPLRNPSALRDKPRPIRQVQPQHERKSRPYYGALTVWIYVALLFTVLVVYSQVRAFDFVGYDDPAIADNPHVNHGITRDGLAWAFTSDEIFNWIPVTQLSHMLDFQLFGARSGLHHLTNVLFHALATLLLFAFLHRATGARWRSAFVAFLFGMHPLHVESVAWIAERKDVLSAFFWCLALWAYLGYTKRPGWGRYLLVLLPFSLGLMAKPMVVTLPFVLLLLDVWPLRRFALGSLPVGAGNPRIARIRWQKALLEKVPFLMCSAGVAVATYLVQRTGGAVGQLGSLSIETRAANALVSYVVYIGQMFWPMKLAVLYPYPSSIPAWQFLTAGIAIVGVSVIVVRSFQRFPYLAVGWIWYLGTLVPVIGLVQVGVQAHADRYMYLPMIGISIMLAWGADDLVRRWPRAKPAVIACIALACSSCIALTMNQLRYWKGSESLYRRALEVTVGNYVMQYNLGLALSKVPGGLPEAIEQYKAAIRIKPIYIDAHLNLGTALASIPGRIPEAIAQYQAALRLRPDYAEAHNSLGVALSQIPGRSPEAIAQYEEALRIKPNLAEAHLNLGVALTGMPDRLPDAIAQYQEALRIKPDYVDALIDLAVALGKTPGGLPQAILHYEEALRIKPDYAEAHNNLGYALSRMPGRLPEAIAHYREALRIKPDYAEAHANLGVALADSPGSKQEAISQLEAALRIRPAPAVQQKLDQLRAGGNAGR